VSLEPALTIVVPCFNEELGLAACAEVIAAWVDKRPAGSIEVVMVDDGSSDGTWKVMKSIVASQPNFRALKLLTNRGAHIALRCGYRAARGHRVVNLPADLQEPIDNLDLLMKEMDENGADAVLAVRRSRADDRGSKISSRLYHSAMKFVNLKNVPLEGAAQFLFSQRVLREINAHDDKGFTIDGYLASARIKLGVVLYDRLAAEGRVSRWTFGKKVQHALDTILGFSNVPIRALSLAGAIAALGGVLYAMFLIYWVLSHEGGVPGWGSLMVVVLVLGGMQLLALGLMGEYAWRILEETRRRPLFQIEAELGGSAGRLEELHADQRDRSA
jgi:polyisoprenyl-phosphate glycosyltransferase